MTSADTQPIAATGDVAARKPSSSESLTAKTLRGLQWTTLSTAAFFVMQMGYQAVINRLLAPETFGVMAIALMAMRFTQLFSTLGVNQALVQKPDIDRRDIRVAFTGSVLLALGVYGIIWLASPLIATFFNEPDVIWVLRGTSAVVLVRGFGVTAEGLMQRRFQFQAIAVREMLAYGVAFLGVGIGLALLGFGVWSLVAAVVTGAVIKTITSYLTAPHSLVPLLQWSRFKELTSYGGRLSIISMIQFASSNLDTTAVGRFTSTALLGQYSRAYFLTSMPTNQLTQGLAQVLFPGLSRIQQDHYRLRRVYLGAIRLMAFALIPICIGMAVASRELVLVLLGPNWDEAITLVPILALAAAFKVMSYVAGVLCDARAELNRKLALQVFHVLLLLGFLWLARGHDLWAYAVAFTAAEFVRYALYQRLAERITSCGMWRLLSAYGPAVLTSTVVAILVYGAQRGVTALGAPAWVVLGAEMVAGGVALALGLRLPTSWKVRVELRRRLGSLMAKRSPVGTLVRAVVRQ